MTSNTDHATPTKDLVVTNVSSCKTGNHADVCVDGPENLHQITAGDTAENQKDESAEKRAEETQYPPLRTVLLIFTALYLAMFLVSLDRSIISTAIPRITDEFHSLNDVGWYGAAYLLTGGSTQLLYGRLYTFLPTKLMFLISLGLFELGSVVSAAAPSSKAFIVGRAIAGLGSSGVFTGVIVISVPIIPLRKRPIAQGVFGAVFGVSSVIGPILGGVLTEKASWRWCFYINLPIGGFAALIVFFLLNLPPPLQSGLSLARRFQLSDPLGTLTFLPSMICMLLALQWGGTTYSWSNWRIVLMLVLFGALLLAFGVIQVYKKSDATVPVKVIRQRSVASAFVYQIFVGAGLMVLQFWLPIWFQAIKGATVLGSGIMLFPLVLSIVPATFIAGFMVTMTGYYTPMMIASAIIRCVGSGLITTFHVNSGHPVWIGYQVIYGFGLGLGMMQANMAVQATLPKEEIPVGTSLVFFAQSLGGAVFLAVVQNVFSHRLEHNVAGVPGVNGQLILHSGATEFRTFVPPQELPTVLTGYNDALSKVFWVGFALSVASILPSLTMEWISVKGRKRGPDILSEEEAAAFTAKAKAEKEDEKREKAIRKAEEAARKHQRIEEKSDAKGGDADVLALV